MQIKTKKQGVLGMAGGRQARHALRADADAGSGLFGSAYPELGRDLLTREHLFFWGTKESGSKLPAQSPVSKEEYKPDRAPDSTLNWEHHPRFPLTPQSSRSPDHSIPAGSSRETTLGSLQLLPAP